ncbi:MAG: arsenite methyltransferase [Anaerolineae bacterium]
MTDIKAEVQKRYGEIARRQSSCCGGGSSCCGPGEAWAPLVDYGELAQEVPAEANLGLGCGISTRFADLQPGQTVLDLGSGAGIDVFLAARIMGPTGLVIGVDMTPDMIKLARRNAIAGGFRNVQFRLGEIEALPVADNSVDVVLSNCVINLVPDKRRAFAEIYRVLKPGGHFSISDIVSFGEAPAEIRQDPDWWASCYGGALYEKEYLRIVEKAGFVRVDVPHWEELAYPRGEGYGFLSITVVGYKP